VREGYLANLVVVEPNPFDVPADQLYTCRVASTWIDGERVYARTAETVDAGRPASTRP